MKLFCAILLSIAFTAITSQVTHQDVAECTGKHPINKDHIKDIMIHGHVEDKKEVKCWISCVMQKSGMMKEGKLDWERYKFNSKLCLTKDEDKAKVDEIAEKCQAEVPEGETDECQFAYSVNVCLKKYWDEFCLKIGNLEQ